jgi:glycosyltransferase involved in cell wall biosynthesis
MRLLYFHQHFSTRQGSAGTRSYEFAKALVAAGHSVVMVCGSYKNGSTGLSGEPSGLIRRGMVEGIEVIEICLAYSNQDGFLKRSLTFLKFALISLGILMKERCDLIFATSTPLTAAIPGIFGKLFLRKPFVFEVRDLWPELPRAMGIVSNPVVLAVLSLIEWSAYRSSNACIALAPGIEKGIRLRSRPTLPIYMIPNGCDLDLFTPEEKKEMRASLGLPVDRPIAVFCGAHGIANGLDAVLDAARVLLLAKSPLQLLFIGEGKKKPELVARSKRESLTNVTFLDPMPKDRLAKLLPLCDIGLQILDNIPEFYNSTSPNKFFDYLSSGLPIVTNYPGWIADLITKHSCGVGVPPDPQALAQALEKLAISQEDRLAMGKRARELAEKDFNREKLAADFTSALVKTQQRL